MENVVFATRKKVSFQWLSTRLMRSHKMPTEILHFKKHPTHTWHPDFYILLTNYNVHPQRGELQQFENLNVHCTLL
jgi:hypothetical protein